MWIRNEQLDKERKKSWRNRQKLISIAVELEKKSVKKEKNIRKLPKKAKTSTKVAKQHPQRKPNQKSQKNIEKMCVIEYCLCCCVYNADEMNEGARVFVHKSLFVRVCLSFFWATWMTCLSDRSTKIWLRLLSYIYFNKFQLILHKAEALNAFHLVKLEHLKLFNILSSRNG